MSSKLNTLDHTVMSLLLKVSAINIAVIARMTKQPRHKVLKSVIKLQDLSFVTKAVVRPVKSGDLFLYSAVLDSSYFPPVHSVHERDFLPWDDEELKALVADVDRRAATENTD